MKTFNNNFKTTTISHRLDVVTIPKLDANFLVITDEQDTVIYANYYQGIEKSNFQTIASFIDTDNDTFFKIFRNLEHLPRKQALFVSWHIHTDLKLNTNF